MSTVLSWEVLKFGSSLFRVQWGQLLVSVFMTLRGNAEVPELSREVATEVATSVATETVDRSTDGCDI